MPSRKTRRGQGFVRDPEMRARIQEVRRKWLSRKGKQAFDEPLMQSANIGARNLAGMTLGLPGDLQSIFHEDLGRLQEQGKALPTSEEMATRLGGDPTHPSYLPAAFLAPGPGELKGLLAATSPIVTKGKNVISGVREELKRRSLLRRPEDRVLIEKQTLSPSDFHHSGKHATIPRKRLFAEEIDLARAKMDPADAAQVDSLADDFVGQVYMTNDGMAGFAISDDGYLSNLFRNPDAKFRGTMGAALTKARAEGAKNLEAFDTYLARGYITRGAVETGRVPWDPQYATPEIIEALGQRKPDFVSMDIGGAIPERKHSLLAGPREQASLERYTVSPTGKPVKEPKSVAPAFQGGKVGRLKRLAEEGIEEGGERWYYLGGLLDEFIAELGPELGKERFDLFMDLNAAVSPRSGVAEQIKRASVLYQRSVKGLPIDNLTNDMFPPGYGHLATTTAHRAGVDRIAAHGAVGNPIDQPKVTSFAENLKGNYQPLTVDTHNNLLVTGRASSPTKNEYAFLEKRQAQIAEQMGLDPAEFQSAIWVGGRKITGVRDARNMTPMINQRIAKTAEMLDIPEAEAKVRFINGDLYLRAVVLGVGVGLLSSQLDRLPASGQEPNGEL